MFSKIESIIRLTETVDNSMLEDLHVLSRNALALNGIQSSASPRVAPSYCLLRIVLLISLSHQNTNINNLGLHQHPINLPFALINIRLDIISAFVSPIRDLNKADIMEQLPPQANDTFYCKSFCPS